MLMLRDRCKEELNLFIYLFIYIYCYIFNLFLTMISILNQSIYLNVSIDIERKEEGEGATLINAKIR